VEIRTLDSFAWRLRRVFSILTPDRAFGYEERIRAVADASENIGAHKDRLDERPRIPRLKAHVFVDEAQDLVGSRAES